MKILVDYILKKVKALESDIEMIEDERAKRGFIKDTTNRDLYGKDVELETLNGIYKLLDK